MKAGQQPDACARITNPFGGQKTVGEIPDVTLHNADVDKVWGPTFTFQNFPPGKEKSGLKDSLVGKSLNSHVMLDLFISIVLLKRGAGKSILNTWSKTHIFA